MNWRRIQQGVRRFVARTASPQTLLPEVVSAPSGETGLSENRVAPYSPDSRNERACASLHLSC
jgi:hypothetical protein